MIYSSAVRGRRQQRAYVRFVVAPCESFLFSPLAWKVVGRCSNQKEVNPPQHHFKKNAKTRRKDNETDKEPPQLLCDLS